MAVSKAPSRSLASDSAYTFVWRCGGYLLGFVSSVLISRSLGPKGRGEYYLPIMAATTAASLCSLALEQINIYLRGTCGYSTKTLSGLNGLVAVVMGAGGFLAVISARAALPAIFADTPRSLLLLAGLSVPFALHTRFAASLLNIDGEVTWPFLSGLIVTLFQVALLVVLFLAHRLNPKTVLGVLLAVAVANWLLVAAKLEGLRLIRIGWNRKLVGEAMRQALLLHPGMFFWFLHLRIDMFMVQAMLGTSSLGQYSLSVTLAETMGLATDSLGMAIIPRQIGNTLEDAAKVSLWAARVNQMIALALVLGWVVAGRTFIRLCFGEAFAPAYWPLLGLLPGIVFMGMARVCGGPVLRVGSPGRFLAIYSFTLACNVLLNLLFIPRLGTFGAGISSSISYGMSMLLFVSWTARLAGASVIDGVAPARSDWTALYHGVAKRLLFLARGVLVE